ncbi:MAG: hypothetical protein AAGD38_03795 [Acidobacteriota bacterium]
MNVKGFRAAGLFMLVMAIAAVPASAGVNRWTAIGPFSGGVTAVAVNDQTFGLNKHIYVGVAADDTDPDIGGVYRSTDAGFTWEEFNDGLDDKRVFDLHIDETAPNPTLWAATASGVYKVTIDGLSPVGMQDPWELSNGVEPTNITTPFSLTVATDPDSPGIVYVGTNGGGVFKSLDGGTSWTSSSLGLGNRVVFDLELALGSSELTINEVDADTPGAQAVETAEFVEIYGPPNEALDGKVLVLFNCRDSTDPGGETGVYAAYDLDGFSTNPAGFFVIGDPELGAVVDFAVPGFVLENESSAVGLYTGDDVDYPIGREDDSDNQLDSLRYDTNQPLVGCGSVEVYPLDPGLLFQNPNVVGDDSVNEGANGDREGHSNQRKPDGGAPALFQPWSGSQSPPTPGTRNRPIPIFAGTDLDGVFRSFNSGFTWAPYNSGLGSEVVFEIAFDPIDPDPLCTLSNYTLYAGSSNAGVYKENDPCDFDNPLDWSAFGLEDETIIAFEVLPSEPLDSVLLAATETGEVNRTTIAGANWTPADLGLGGLPVESFGVDLEIQPLINPFRPSIVYAGTIAGTVFKTEDEANNWFQTSPDLSDTTGVFVEKVVVDPGDDSLIYVATVGGGLFRGQRAGSGASALWTFTRLVFTDPGTGDEVLLAFDVVLDPTNTNTLWVGTDFGVFKTDNAQAAVPVFTQLDLDVTVPEPFSVLELLLDPNDATANTLYAVTGNLYRTTNGGTTWTRLVETVAPLTNFNNATITTVAVAPDDADTIYAGTQSSFLYQTSDGGSEWAERNAGNGLTEQFMRAILVDATDSSILWLGTDGGGVFKSFDAGDSWNPFNNGVTSSFILTLEQDPMDPQLLYAGTENGGLLRSNDAGANWSSFNPGLTNDVVTDVEIFPTDNNLLWAATDGGGVFGLEIIQRVVITPTNGLTTTEGGVADSFQVALTSVPTADVSFSIVSSDDSEGIVSADQVLFTPDDALIPQSVVITGVDDNVLDGDQPYLVLTGITESADPDFNGLDPEDVSVINLDAGDSDAGVTITPFEGLVTNELGGTATFEVILDRIPTGTVSFTLESSDLTEGRVSPDSLTFTPQNALTPQVVTVTGVIDDGLIDGDVPYQILTGFVDSSDMSYQGINPVDVSVVNEDLGATTIFETATLGAIGQSGAGTFAINSTTFLGASFTTTDTFNLTSIGGHVVATDGQAGQTIFVALVPVLGNGLPADTDLTNDAIFASVVEAPQTSDEIKLLTGNIELPPGNYAVVFGSGQFGATGSARMPGNDIDLGSPNYFFSSAGSWFTGGLTNSRFFLNGFSGPVVGPNTIFIDGFESGDTSAWSGTVP